MNVTILGAGPYGLALATVLEENQHRITFYDPAKYPQTSLEQAISSAQIILVATPPGAITTLAPRLKSLPIPIIISTQGLLTLEAFTPHPVSLISGPTFAEDLLRKTPATTTVTSPLARTLFATHWLHPELTPDYTGVMLCGSLKGVYALGAGLIAAPAGYTDKCLAELKLYLANHQASASTADLSCGAQALQLACNDPRSHEFQFGLAFSRSPQAVPAHPITGLETLATLHDYKKYPIIRAIHEVLSGRRQSLEKLIAIANEA